MLKQEIGITLALPLDITGTTFGTYLKRIEEEHNVTMRSYDPLKNLITYTGEIEALRWFIRKELKTDWDDIEKHILILKEDLPPLWNITTFSDLLRQNEWNYTMDRIEGYIAPYQYKMEFNKTINSRKISVKIPWVSTQPEINIYEEKENGLTLLKSFTSGTTHLGFEESINYLNKIMQ